ncbi:hypothetical protein Tc00.1047053506281.14 [Trypanosoma cruzi]|uniref:Uncharacterized protein n=1 Tax=Trypanosoma cruzi (strain CL Brener) TaxID=353153 RepID=Q4DC52_TRYCC|nr:hypothetical protein Tc00.1047053506281.14 [Trypanosoma cruzi]EAN90105.1 hypothetical protein Tc00.1047053506281.14 [Trypanosoma cruzi]|eukprot:XP_811956.1 hypothetical protein [Trypanosoma cruzi strain CL Brener]
MHNTTKVLNDPTPPYASVGANGAATSVADEEDARAQKKAETTPKASTEEVCQTRTSRGNGEEYAKDKTALAQMQLQLRTTVTAAPRSPTPPPLFCFLLLCVRLLLRWWPRESECERAVHRPHTHSSFSLCVCVSPCMDSRPHLTTRGTHNNVPIVYMHAHPCRPVGALFCTSRTAAVLPGCMGGAP